MNILPDIFRLDSAGQQAESNFVRWCGAMGALFDVAATPAEIATFSGEIFNRFTARVMVSAISCSSLQLLRSPSTMERAALDHFGLCLVTAGKLAGRTDRDAFDCPEGGVFFLDLMQTLDMTLSTTISSEANRAKILILWIPRARMLKSLNDESALHGLALRDVSPVAHLLAACLNVLALEAEATGDAAFDALAEGVIELTAKALGPVLQSIAPKDRPTPIASLVVIRRFIDRHLASGDLGVNMLAEKFGLSRATLYRLFEPLGGVADYIREQRLRLAYQEVVAAEFSNRRIGLIGFRLGFKNVSSFSRAFRQRFGVSPRGARSAALKRSPPKLAAAPPACGTGSLADRLKGVTAG